MGKLPPSATESGKSHPAGTEKRLGTRCGSLLAWLAWLPVAGCLDSDRPLLSAQDPSLQPALETIHTVATTWTGGDSIPGRLIEAGNLTAALIWAHVNDTVYHQAVRVNREWPLRLDAPMVSTPPPEALFNVSGNGRGRYGMSLLFLFDDANGNGRYDMPEGDGDAGAPPPPGSDWLMGVAGGARIVYISDTGALEWLRAHPPKDGILTVNDPSRLRVGFNLLVAANIRDTVFHEYRIHYPGGGFSLSPTPPDSGEYETLSYPRKICDGFEQQEWSREVPLTVGASLDVFASLVTVAPTPAERP